MAVTLYKFRVSVRSFYLPGGMGGWRVGGVLWIPTTDLATAKLVQVDMRTVYSVPADEMPIVEEEVGMGWLDIKHQIPNTGWWGFWPEDEGRVQLELN